MPHEEGGGDEKAFAEELEEECMEPGSNPFLKIMPTRPGSRLKGLRKQKWPSHHVHMTTTTTLLPTT